MDNILLVDGNLLLFKSFYSTLFNKSEFKNSKGLDNRTIHRFFSTLLNVIDNYKIKYIFIAFDAHAQTKRSKIYAEYKHGRTRPDPIIYQYKKHITNLLDKMKIKWLEKAGDEADDLIASINSKFINLDNKNFLILSDDQDLLQLVSKNTSIVYKNQKSKKFELKTNDNFADFFGFSPKQIIDFKAINGDSSDNLPGVKGIGKVGATKLIQKYNSLENIFDHINELSKSEIEKFSQSKDIAFLCKQLATLKTDIKLSEIDLENLKEFNLFNLDVEAYLEYLELSSIAKLAKKLNDKLF